MALDDDALSRAIIMAGFGMMNSPNAFAGLSRGGMFGMQAYDQGIEQKRKLQDDALAQQARTIANAQATLQLGQAQDWDSAMKQLAARMGTGPAPASPAPPAPPSVVNAPGWASSPVNPSSAAAPPSVRASGTYGTPQNDQSALLQQLALRFPEKVKAIFDAQRAGEGKVYGDLQKDTNGRVYVMTELGPKYLGNGAPVPRDKIVAQDLGGQVGFHSEYSPELVGVTNKTLSPGEAATNARENTRLYFETGMGGGGGGGARGGSGPAGGSPPLGSGMFGLAPKAQQELAQNQQQALNTAGVQYKSNLDNTVQVGNDLMLRLNEARDALQSFKPGMGAEARLQAARAAQMLNLPDDLVSRINGGDVSAKQEFMKLAAQQAMESLKQAMGGSGRITQAEFKVFQANNPNIELDPRAVEKIFNFTQRTHMRNMAEQGALDSYLQQGGPISRWPTAWTRMSGGGVQPEGAPKIGTVKQGYAYIGGDPSNPSSWKKTQ